MPHNLALKVSIRLDCARGRSDRERRALFAVDGHPIEFGRRIERINDRDARSIANLRLNILDLVEHEMIGAQFERGQFTISLHNQMMTI